MDVAAPVAPAPAQWSVRPVPCNLCGSEAFREIYPSRLPDLATLDIQDIYACTSCAYGECGPIVQCSSCGFVYQNPQPDPECTLDAYENVVDVRGIGLMLGIELSSADLAKHITAQLMDRRIIANRTSETVLRFLPPFILERKHVETAVKALDEIVSATYAGAAPVGEQSHG